MGNLLPITVIIPVKNEEANLPGCLRSVKDFAQVIVVDSGSTDRTLQIAQRSGAEIYQFDYSGGWPKKRQWAMDHLAIRCPWTLLLDADERVSPSLRQELKVIANRNDSAAPVGYWTPLRLRFLGKTLLYGASDLKKLSFFRSGLGRFECLIEEQTAQMADMEIHEHIVLDGREGHCRNHLVHHNHNDLFRYIEKHNHYSTWSAELAFRQQQGRKAPGQARVPSLFGGQADRRRWLMNRLWRLPAGGFLLPILRFLWFFIIRFGFLDGKAGYYYCGFKAVQAFHIMAKNEELSITQRLSNRKNN